MKKLLSLLMLLVAIVTGASAADASLNDFPTGTSSFKTGDSGYYQWGDSKTKNQVIYDTANRIMLWSNGNALDQDATGLKIGNSNKKSAFVFKVANTSDISVVVARNGSDMTASIYYLGATAEVLTDPNNMSPTGALDSESISSSNSPATLTVEGGDAGYYMVFGTLRFYASSITITETTPATKHTVTYDLGAATAGTLPTQADVAEGKTFTVAAAPVDLEAPSGQEFKCWNDGTNDYDEGVTYTMGTSNVTLTAVYQTITVKYDVTYDLNGATAGTAPTQASLAEGKTFTVAAAPADLVAPTGKEFVGWNDGSADYSAGDTYTVGTSDVTLTAVYQDKTYQGLTPTETLDFANLGSTFSTMWFDNSGKMDNNFYFDAVNGKVVISAYAIYQSNASDRNLNLWATTDSGNSSSGTWTATGDFKGSTYYFNDDARAANIQASARVHYYRVTGITSVSALFNGKAAIEAYEVNSGVVSPDYAKQNKISSAGTATITELDADKEYVILVRGDNGTSGIRFYEIEFTFPAVTTETVTIPSEGFATYVTSSALDFSSQNGAFKAYVASSVNDAKTSVATTEVTKVPAGTALLLKGAAGSYDVEIAESADAVTNLLKASNGGVKGDNSTVFAYSKSAGKFKKVAQDVVIPAGKAYLKLEAEANPDAIDIDFEQATGIYGIADKVDNEAPVKVIKKGKLYIGNYNVAGQQVK